MTKNLPARAVTGAVFDLAGGPLRPRRPAVPSPSQPGEDPLSLEDVAQAEGLLRAEPWAWLGAVLLVVGGLSLLAGTPDPLGAIVAPFVGG